MPGQAGVQVLPAAGGLDQGVAAAAVNTASTCTGPSSVTVWVSGQLSRSVSTPSASAVVAADHVTEQLHVWSVSWPAPIGWNDLVVPSR